VSGTDRPVLPRDLAGTVAHAGVDPTLEGRALQDDLRRAIATRRGYCAWTADHAGWVATLHLPEEHDFSGKTMEEVFAWCLGRNGTPKGGGIYSSRRPPDPAMLDPR
jgi:hypothetical protein